MMNRKLIATGLIGLMGIAVGCKPRSSELRGVELADKDESSGKAFTSTRQTKRKSSIVFAQTPGSRVKGLTLVKALLRSTLCSTPQSSKTQQLRSKS